MNKDEHSDVVELRREPHVVTTANEILQRVEQPGCEYADLVVKVCHVGQVGDGIAVADLGQIDAEVSVERDRARHSAS